MEIYSVFDPEFKEFGKVLSGYDTAELIKAKENVEMPAEGTAYEPWIDSLEACGIFKQLGDNAFGGMPIELGMCWGYNKAPNCLEYHRNSEINIGATDFVLLLDNQEKIIDGMKVYTREQIENALKTAGFSDVKTDHHLSKPWITVLAKKGINEAFTPAAVYHRGEKHEYTDYRRQKENRSASSLRFFISLK